MKTLNELGSCRKASSSLLLFIVSASRGTQPVDYWSKCLMPMALLQSTPSKSSAGVKKAPGVILLQTAKITVVHLPSTATEHAQHCYRACLSSGPGSEIASPIALSATATEHGTAKEHAYTAQAMPMILSLDNCYRALIYLACAWEVTLDRQLR